MSHPQSLTREAQYRELANYEINGKILDLGGSRLSGYHELIKGSHTIDVANINPGLGTDLVFDVEEKFPIEDGVYDAVLCLNVLEHLFEYQNAVDESFRVLKRGGIIIGSTPFIQPIHGSPDDYFRYTSSAFFKIFHKAGFSQIEVKELGTGLFGAVYELTSGLYRFRWLKEIAKYQIVLDKILRFLKKDNKFSEKYMALGYFFFAKK